MKQSFSLRSLCILITIITVVIALVTALLRKNYEQAHLVSQLAQRGVTVQKYIQKEGFNLSREIKSDSWDAWFSIPKAISIYRPVDLETLNTKLPTVESVNFVGMRVDSQRVAALKKLFSPKNLWFTRCEIASDTLSELAKLDLESLHFISSLLPEDYLDGISKLHTVEELEFAIMDLSGSQLLNVASMPRLHRLELRGLNNPSSLIGYLALLEQLNSLVLESLTITAHDGSSIAKLGDLQKLVLIHCSILPATVELIQRELPGCKIQVIDSL